MREALAQVSPAVLGTPSGGNRPTPDQKQDGVQVQPCTNSLEASVVPAAADRRMTLAVREGRESDAGSSLRAIKSYL